MVQLTALWLPIVVAAAAMFLLSFLCWMVLPHHRKDYQAIPDEDGLMAFLRGKGLAPGQYSFPHCAGPEAMKDPAWLAKRDAGPGGMLQIVPASAWNMGPTLAKWFVLLLAVGLFIAYLAGRVLPVGAEYLTVFRVVGTATFLAFCIQPVSDGIWKSTPCRTVLASVFDGLLYSLATAGVFAWLWPAAV